MEVNQSRLDAYLKKISPAACPLCGDSKWTISKKVFQALEYEATGIFASKNTYPMVPLTCRTCGNTYFINSLVAGLIDPLPDSPQNSDSSSS